MEPRQRVRKSVALVSAVLLVGAFVLYRGGTGFMAGSKSNPAFTFVEPPAPAAPKGATPQSPPPKAVSASDWTFTITPGGKTPAAPVTPVSAKPDE